MKLILLNNLFLIFITSLRAQCLSTSFNNGSSFSTDNSIGVYNFSSPSNAQASDNARANAASLIGILTGNTYYLKVTGFNFSIPSYASICGVTVNVECRATGLLFTAAVRDNEVRLIKANTITGNNYAKAGDWGISDVYNSYGGAADLWGTTLTPADVNASSFGVAFSARIVALIAALPGAEIDHIRMKIDYNPVLPLHLLYFKCTSKNKAIVLEWKTTGEEDYAAITLQRSSDNTTDWLDIKRYESSGHNNDNVYHYEDIPLRSGKYAYRLKLNDVSGTVTWSEIRYVITEDTNTLSVYPNPAASFIIISPLQTSGDIIITDIFSRRVQLPVEKTGTAAYRINIESLPKGIYFIKKGNQTIKIIKE